MRNRARWVLLGISIVTMAACSTSLAPSEPPAVHVTGVWEGYRGFRGVSMTLQQSGARVTGVIAADGLPVRSVEGTVTGNSLSLDDQPLHYHATVVDDRMDGMVTGFVIPVQLTAIRKR
jgi:hypothetical protein